MPTTWSFQGRLLFEKKGAAEELAVGLGYSLWPQIPSWVWGTGQEDGLHGSSTEGIPVLGW